MRSVLLFLIFVAFSSEGVRSEPFALPEEEVGADKALCPPTVKEWLTNRRTFAFLVSRDSYRLSQYGVRCLEGARKELEVTPELKACFAPLLAWSADLTAAWDPKRDEREWPFKTEKDYYAAFAERTKVPMELAAANLLEALRMPDVKAAEKYLDGINAERAKRKAPKLDYVRFSGLVGATDGSGRDRFLIYDPGTPGRKPNTETWVNFAIGRKDAVQLSVVSTVTDEKGVRRSYFADHARRQDERGGVKIVPFHEEGGSFNCYGCHIGGGPIAIRSMTRIATKYQPAVERINARIAELGITFNEYAANTADIGRMSILGSVIPDRFLKDCAKEGTGSVPSEEIVARVRGALNCHRCHNGGKRPRLRDLAKVNAHEYIELGAMPPGNKLSAEERKMLTACFSRYNSEPKTEAAAARVGLLYYLLTAGKCSDDGRPSGVPSEVEHER